MKTITLLLILLLFVSFVAFGTIIVSFALVDKSFISSITNQRDMNEVETVSIGHCTSKVSLDIRDTKDPALLSLKETQNTCLSYVTNRMMIFTDMPKDAKVAQENAKEMATRLREFNKNGVTPVVIVEPASDWGLIDFQEFNTGFYDNWVDTYFKALKSSGISQEEMGIWVPFPEANIPTWNKNSATPKDFALGVNRYGGILMRYYPETHISILLNSATYDNEDYDWIYGEYVSLKPYVEYLDKNLISSVGLQGFPWVPQLSSASNPLENPSQFLNHRLAQEAAEIIGVKEIWFNTGTFGRKYTQTPLEEVEISSEKRKAILDGVTAESLELQSKGYEIWVNLFVEDKSSTTEQTDWSYKTDTDRQVFVEFVRRLNEENILLSLFDQKV